MAEVSEVDSVEDSEEDAPAVGAHPEVGDKVSGGRFKVSGLRCQVSGFWTLFFAKAEGGVLIGEFNRQGEGKRIEFRLQVVEHHGSFGIAPFHIENIGKRGWH